MDRREFVRLAGSGMAAGALAETLVAAQVARTPPPRNRPASNSKVKFKVGTQHGDSDAILKAMAAFGVQQHLRQHAVGEARREMVRRGADETSRARRVVRHQARHDADHDDVGLDRSRADARDLAGPESRARPQHRRHLHADPQLRESRHLPGEVQLHDRRHPAVGPGQRARPVDLQRVRPRERSRTKTSRRSPAKSAPTSTGSASRISSSGSCRLPRNTR